MSYEVKITHQADSGDGISVEARVNGEPVAHTFPKGFGFFDEPEEGRPAFVQKLIEKYKDKIRRQGKVAQSAMTGEERKIHNNKFQNKVYGEDSKSFKDEGNKDSIMQIDLDDAEQIRTYLKENMAEGYLSEEEGMNIDEFVDRYEELLDMKQSFQEIIKELQGGKVE